MVFQAFVDFLLSADKIAGRKRQKEAETPLSQPVGCSRRFGFLARRMRMIIIRKPEEEELLPLVREASHDGAVPDEEWQKHFLKIFEKELRGDPKQYMAFGYYWWILKKEFISHGIGLFGTTIDEESAAMLDYGSTGLNLMACYSYYRDRRSQHRLYEKEHEYFYRDTETEQGKPVWHKEIFELEDPDVGRSFNGPTKRHVNGPAFDGVSLCPKGGFS